MEVKRVMKGSQKLNHDLFKLEVASMRRNVSWNKRQPIWDNVEHSHYFHTIDSNGRTMTECVAICGHKHPVTVKEVKGSLVATCGEAEGHTHKCTYLHSEEMQTRKISADAASIINEYEKVLSGKATGNE